MNYLPVYLKIYHCFSLGRNFGQAFSLCVFLFVCLCVSVFVWLIVFVGLFAIFLRVCLSYFSSTSFLLHLFVCWFACLFTYFACL